MTTTTQSVLDRARFVLQDPTAVRYTDAELVAWVNDGQRAVYAVKKDVSATNSILNLAEGTQQTLPVAAELLLDIPRAVTQAGAPAQAVRLVDMALMDAQAPGWHADRKTYLVSDYMYDPREPKVFYVYPPALSGAKVLAKYSVPPTTALLAGNLTIDDVYSPILLDYVLYRAYSKETEGVLRDRAILYKQAFDSALGDKSTTDDGENARVSNA